MIFALFGSTRLEFSRLVLVLENLLSKKLINEDIIAQTGHTKYHGTRIKAIPFMSEQQIFNMINDSSIVISHAGTGSAISVLEKNKKLILFPRYSELNEHVDNHQLELARVFYKKNLCNACFIDDDPLIKIMETKENNYQNFESNTPKFLKEIEKLIEK